MESPLSSAHLVWCVVHEEGPSDRSGTRRHTTRGLRGTSALVCQCLSTSEGSAPIQTHSATSGRGSPSQNRSQPVLRVVANGCPVPMGGLRPHRWSGSAPGRQRSSTHVRGRSWFRRCRWSLGVVSPIHHTHDRALGYLSPLQEHRIPGGPCLPPLSPSANRLAVGPGTTTTARPTAE
jgi:hypothetical protein